MKNNILLAVLISSLSLSSYAGIYHYVDESGKKVFVDSLSKVPHQYRNQLKGQETTDFSLTPEAKAKKDLLRSIQNVSIEQRHSKQKILDAMQTYAVPLRKVSGKPVIQVVFRDGTVSRTLSLQMDFNSPAQLLKNSVASRFSAKPGTVGTLQVLGSTEKVRPINLSKIEFGPYNYSYRDFYIVNDGVLPPGVDGVLSKQILSGINYQVDTQNNKLIFEPEHYASLQDKLKEVEELIAAQQEVEKGVQEAESLEGRDIQLLENATVKDLPVGSGSQPSK